MKLTIITNSLPDHTTQIITDFLESHPHNTVFQSPAYYKLYKGQDKFHPTYFVVCNDKGIVIGLMLAVIISHTTGYLSYFSSRCLIYGGPLVTNDDHQIIRLLLTALHEELSKKSIFTQFRNFRKWDNKTIQLFQTHGYHFRDRLNLIIELTDQKSVLAGFSKSRRRQLKQAMTSECIIRNARNHKEIKELYELLHLLYKKKIKKPLPDLSFFYEFFDQLIPSGNGIILIALSQQKIIGGIVAPVTPNKTISELYVCGLDKQYPAQRPSIMLTWAALDYGIQNKIPSFDFMGLGTPHIPYGVRDFKLRFGGITVNHGRLAKRNNKFAYFLAEIAYNILRMVQKV